jgi:hypothetical protein
MPFPATAVRVLIASPSDLREQRDLVERAIHRWNAVQSAYAGVVLLPVRWEINASAEMGAPAQDVINRQIVDDSDILIGLFWTRLGTPTANHESGTAEELNRFLDAGKPAALYVARIPADPFTVDHEQMAALKEFLDIQRKNGLLGEFQTPEELTAQVTDSLTRFVREHFEGQVVTAPSPATPVAATADVRAEHYSVGTDHRVVIQNVGTGEARNVTVENVAARNEPRDDERSWQLLGAEAPVDFLAPGGTMQFPVPITFGSPPRVNVTVRWLNPDDSEGSSRQTLSIY